MNFDLGGTAAVVASPSPSLPFMYSSHKVPRWPLLKQWSKEKEDRTKGSDRGQVNHREIHLSVKKKCMQETMREFATLSLLLYLLILPESQWTNEQLHHPSHCHACLLQQSCTPPLPKQPHPHCTGTMSFLKVISSQALGQPSSRVHYTQSSEIHYLNTPLLVSPH